MAQRYQVIIVGGGPVGSALAVDLGLRGVSCAVVERHESPQRIPKGQSLTARTLEHFYFWGIDKELRAARLLPPGYPIGGITAYRDLASDYWYVAGGARSTSGPRYYFQANERLPQYLTEEVLRARLEQLPNVKALYGWTARSFEQDDQGVRVTVAEERRPGEEEVLEADYLVGCDGAHSMVREGLGIRREGTDFEQRMVLTVLRSRDLHEGLKRFPERTTYRVMKPELRGYWQFFGRIDVGEGFFFHAPVPDGTTADNYDFQALIQDAAGFPLDATFDHIGFWDLRVQVATRYRAGRAFIAGDACHSHPPYGGFGLNSGLEDIANLGWKLAAALQGWGGEELLDSYTTERQPIFMETGEHLIAGRILSDRAFLERYSPERDRAEFEKAWRRFGDLGTGMGEAASQDEEQTEYEPHYEGSPVVFGPEGAACSVHGRHSLAARPGHHLAPRVLSTGRDVFEALGPGFTLLAVGDREGDVRSMQDAANTLRIPLKVIRDEYEGEPKAYGSGLIVVRPDQYVAWAGDEAPTEPQRLWKQITGRA